MTKVKPRLIARISCQECRRRKTRCNFDGQNQKCSTCARIGTPCIFTQKNGVVLDMEKVMEENNPHLAHQREKDHRAREKERDRERQRAKLIAAGVDPSQVEVMLMNMSPPAVLLSPDFAHSLPGRTNNFPSLHQSTPATKARSESLSEDLSSVMDRLQIDAFGIAPHTLRSFSQVAGDNDSCDPSSSESSCESAPLAGSNYTPTLAHNPDQDMDQDSNVLPNFPARKHSASRGHRTHRSSHSRSLPLVDIRLDLIDLYFKHVHPFMLILHKPSFFRRLYDPRDPVPGFLLAAMYALASHYAPGHEEEGRKFFEIWQSKLDDTLDKPRLSTIQALLMVIKYQEGVKKTGFYFRTYMYTQMLVVMARELQLHKTTPVNAKLDPESHEVRRRLFWSIFVLDQFMSVSQGRTMSFREVEPEADLPGTDNEDPNDLEEIELIQNAVEFIKLVKIDHQGQILIRKFLTKALTPEATVPQGLFLHQAMLTWKANLPPRLQLSSNMSPHTPFVAMLHILYHACTIMIQRSYCDNPSVSHLGMAAASRESCSISATNITVIIDDLYTNHGMVPLTYPMRGCYFIIYTLIAAATIQVQDIRKGGSSPIMFKRSVALLNIILRQSTAVDIEKEVEVLKSSLDSPMEASRSDFASTSPPTHHYDHRPPLKPILPMSQKYGSRMSFSGGSVTPARVRKISPKGSSPSSQSRELGHSPGSKSRSPGGGECGNGGALSARGGMESLFPTSSSPGFNGTCETGGQESKFRSTDQSAPNQAKNHQYSDRGDQEVEDGDAGDDDGSDSEEDDDIELIIKTSASPEWPAKPLSNQVQNQAQANTPTTDPFLQSVPTFTAPSSLPSDFNAFAQQRQQIMAASGAQDPVPLMSLAQLLSFQKQQQEELSRQRAAVQLQAQQQLERQKQQQQQLSQSFSSQDPTLVSHFLSNFSNLTHYEQLNSDQDQNDLLNILDSSMFGYNDVLGQSMGVVAGGNSDSLNSSLGFGSNFGDLLTAQPFQQQHQHQQRLSEDQETHNTSMSSPESSLSSAFSPGPFVPQDRSFLLPL